MLKREQNSKNNSFGREMVFFVYLNLKNRLQLVLNLCHIKSCPPLFSPCLRSGGWCGPIGRSSVLDFEISPLEAVDKELLLF